MKLLRIGSGFAVLVLAGCGGGLSGDYGSVNSINGQWEKTFSFSGSTVEISAMGQTRVGGYKLKDGKVYITIGGETQALAIDDKGCIDGGFLFGRNCRK